MAFGRKKPDPALTKTGARTVMRCANCGKHVIIVEITTKGGQALCSRNCKAKYEETERAIKEGQSLRKKAKIRKFAKKHWKYLIPIGLLLIPYFWYLFFVE